MKSAVLSCKSLARSGLIAAALASLSIGLVSLPHTASAATSTAVTKAGTSTSSVSMTKYKDRPIAPPRYDVIPGQHIIKVRVPANAKSYGFSQFNGISPGQVYSTTKDGYYRTERDRLVLCESHPNHPANQWYTYDLTAENNTNTTVVWYTSTDCHSTRVYYVRPDGTLDTLSYGGVIGYRTVKATADNATHYWFQL